MGGTIRSGAAKISVLGDTKLPRSNTPAFTGPLHNNSNSRIDLYERGEGMDLNDKQEGRSDDENAEPSLARREEEETKSMDVILSKRNTENAGRLLYNEWDPSPKGS